MLLVLKKPSSNLMDRIPKCAVSCRRHSKIPSICARSAIKYHGTGYEGSLLPSTANLIPQYWPRFWLSGLTITKANNYNHAGYVFEKMRKHSIDQADGIGIGISDGYNVNLPKMVICFAGRNYGEWSVCRAMDKGNIDSEAAAKNCITVDASRSSRDLTPRLTSAAMDAVKNRRHKPDVVAPGTYILSANSSMVRTPANPGPHNHWCNNEGTSIATLWSAETKNASIESA